MFVGGVPALMVMLYFIVSPGVFLLWTRFTGAALQVAPVCVAAAVAYTSSVVFKISTALACDIPFCGKSLQHCLSLQGSAAVATQFDPRYGEGDRERKRSGCFIKGPPILAMRVRRRIVS